MTEALDMIYQDKSQCGPSSSTICICPSGPSVDTDVDSGKENRGCIVDNLSRRQLQEPSELGRDQLEDEIENVEVEETKN